MTFHMDVHCLPPREMKGEILRPTGGLRMTFHMDVPLLSPPGGGKARSFVPRAGTQNDLSYGCPPLRHSPGGEERDSLPSRTGHRRCAQDDLSFAASPFRSPPGDVERDSSSHGQGLRMTFLLRRSLPASPGGEERDPLPSRTGHRRYAQDDLSFAASISVAFPGR